MRWFAGWTSAGSRTTDDAAFARYVGEGQWFVAIEVHPADVGGELTALQPLVVSWRGADFPITHELTYDPAGGLVETDLWVLAPWKAAVADGDARLEYASSFALHPSDTTLGAFGLSSGWLTRLHLERRMADVEQRDSALVAAEDTEEVLVEGLVTRQLRVRIAQACCAGQKIPTGGARTFHETREYDASSPPSDASYFYSAPDAPNANCPGGEAYDPPYGTSDYDYACSVSSVAASWGPLVLALGLLVRRRRR
jgi:MYXO-CTERM domain-containing protein